MRKAEILGHRLVEDAERLREVHATLDPDVAASSYAPRGAREVAETIDRDDHRLIEGRNVECGG
jgi:hypothetical protein